MPIGILSASCLAWPESGQLIGISVSLFRHCILPSSPMRSYLLMTIDDDEFYEKQRPLPLADLTVLVSILKEVSMPCLPDTPQNCAENVTGLCYICSFVQYVACCGLPCQCLLL